MCFNEKNAEMFYKNLINNGKRFHWFEKSKYYGLCEKQSFVAWFKWNLSAITLYLFLLNNFCN